MRELPMFPLGTVLFPHMVLPLQIFEPRYRALIDEVLAGDREFGVTLITRGHEVGGGDERADVGTVARVLQAEEQPDGRWLVVAVGDRRIRVRRWLADRPYPCAVVDDLPDRDDDGPLPDGLERRLRRVLALRTELGAESVPATLEVDDAPCAACWQIAVAAPLTAFDAQRVLEAPGCRDRGLLLDDLLAGVEEVLRFRLHGGDAAPRDEG